MPAPAAGPGMPVLTASSRKGQPWASIWAWKSAANCRTDERMGHADGSVQARYTHVTAAMRAQLLDGLTGLWEEALDARAALAQRSPVVVLDRLLTQREAGR